MKLDDHARAAMRTATAGHHQRVNDAFSGVVLGDIASYGWFLRAQAAAHLPVEDALTTGGVAAVVSDWPARQRSALLRSDLAELGLDVPPAAGTIRLDTEAALLGALYVLEGSRLGGTLLKRSVAPDAPARFLGGGESAMWRSLLALLDERLDTAIKRDEAIMAAGEAFDLFRLGATLHLRRG